jgi:hypothetical protein
MRCRAVVRVNVPRKEKICCSLRSFPIEIGFIFSFQFLGIGRSQRSKV